MVNANSVKHLWGNGAALNEIACPPFLLGADRRRVQMGASPEKVPSNKPMKRPMSPQGIRV
jgi:hypothetical protein